MLEFSRDSIIHTAKLKLGSGTVLKPYTILKIASTGSVFVDVILK